MSAERTDQVDFYVSVDNDKYTFVSYKNGKAEALRYKETWRDCIGDGFILTLAQEIFALREKLKAVTDRKDEIYKDLVQAANNYQHSLKENTELREKLKEAETVKAQLYSTLIETAAIAFDDLSTSLSEGHVRGMYEEAKRHPGKEYFESLRIIENRLKEAEADVAALREFLEQEVMPRYCELFEVAGLGTESVVIDDADKLLSNTHPGAELMSRMKKMEEFVIKFDELMEMEDKYVAAWDKLLPSVREARAALKLKGE